MKVRVKGDKKPTTPSAAELEAANMLARRIALQKNLLSGENTHVGNQIPKFYDRTGRELTSADAMPPVGRFTNKVPLYVKSLEWDDTAQLPYYIDEKTGDTQYVAKELFYSPRFRKATPNTSIVNSIAKL